MIELGRHAVAMSRASGLWVALKIVTNVADGVGIVDADVPFEPVAPGVLLNGKPFRHRLSARMLQPALADMERSREGIPHSVTSHSESSRSACWYSWGFGER